MELYTVKEVASKLRLSISKVYDLLREGKLSCYRFDGAYRIGSEHIQEYLENSDVLKRKRTSTPRPSETFTELNPGRLYQAWEEQSPSP